MKRGEIWTASGGPDYAGKPRPVLIVQDNRFGETASITVCPLTTHALDASLVRPSIVASSDNGLKEDSFAMIDKITTVARSRLGRRVGRLKDTDMLRLNQAMMVFLGLAAPARTQPRRAPRA